MQGGHATSEVSLGSGEPGQGGPARLGPLVHRVVHRGAIVWIVAAVQFVIVMAVVQAAWSGPPSYSLAHNYISDLGNTACGPWPHATSARVCSPWHDVFDGSSVALGILVLLGAVLVRSAFPRRGSTTVGLALLMLAGIGSIGVGLSPENVDLAVHSLSAAIAFVLGNLSLIVLGVAMFRDTRWNGYRAYSMLSGLWGLVAFLLFYTGHYLGLGVGGMERMIVAPLLLWLVVCSVHLLRVPQYAPSKIPGVPGS
jgi:hypothetical membrane protein